MAGLDELLWIMQDMSLVPPDCPEYINHGRLDHKIDRIIFSKTTYDYEMVFKEHIDIDKLKKVSEKFWYRPGFLENDETVCVNYCSNALNPIMTVEKKSKMVRFRNNKIGFALDLIKAYLEYED